jgi:hypothetical protein
MSGVSKTGQAGAGAATEAASVASSVMGIMLRCPDEQRAEHP